MLKIRLALAHRVCRPEQFGGMGQTDERTDIYSLGATMYRLVTGHNPSEPPYEMYPITHWNPRLSTGLEGIIAKCTSTPERVGISQCRRSDMHWSITGIWIWTVSADIAVICGFYWQQEE